MKSVHTITLAGDPRAQDRMKITLEPEPEGVRVTLVGELDIATGPAVDRILDNLCGQGHRWLMLDLEGVRFMDSTGLASIVRALRAAQAGGHRLTLRRGSAQVQRVFELTGMLDQLTFEN